MILSEKNLRSEIRVEPNTVALAKKFKVSPRKIRYWLDKYGVARRSNTANGYRTRNSSGYILIFVGKGKHGTTKGGYAYEHRVVMEKHLGRKLKTNEHVHHKNEIKDDNRLVNLEVLPEKQHRSQHATEPDGLRKTSSIHRTKIHKLVQHGFTGGEIAAIVYLSVPVVLKMISELDIFPCAFCSRSFSKFKAVGVHIRRTHGGCV